MAKKKNVEFSAKQGVPCLWPTSSCEAMHATSERKGETENQQWLGFSFKVQGKQNQQQQSRCCHAPTYNDFLLHALEPLPSHYTTLPSKLGLSLCILVTMRLLLSLLLYSIGDLRCLKLLLTFKKMFCSTIQVSSDPPNSIFPTNPVVFVVWNSVMPWLWGVYVLPCMRNNCLFTEPSS